MHLQPKYILRGDSERQAITHIRECSDDSNQCTSYRRKPDTHDIRPPVDRPRMATFHNDTIRSVRIPPLPSAHLPRNTAHRGYPWVARALS
jgi:hypothetical protein